MHLLDFCNFSNCQEGCLRTGKLHLHQEDGENTEGLISHGWIQLLQIQNTPGIFHCWIRR